VPSRKKILVVAGVAATSVIIACVLIFVAPQEPPTKEQREEAEGPVTVSTTSPGATEEVTAVGQEGSQAASVGGQEPRIPSEVETLIGTAPAEALENIYRVEVERFVERLREDKISNLEMQFCGEWLTMCLADETACRALEDWLFKRSQAHPNDMQSLLTVMSKLRRIAPDVLKNTVDRAISEDNWLLVASALPRFKGEPYPPEWIADVAEKAIASDDPAAQYYAVTYLASPAVLPREVCQRLIQPILREGNDNIEVETAAMFRALRYNLADPKEVLGILEQRLLYDDDPARRYIAYRALYTAGRQGLLLGEQGEATKDNMMVTSALSMALTLDYIAEALRDPDPLARLGVTIDYLECERFVEQARRFLSDMP